jgi:integrase/recombinase XerD
VGKHITPHILRHTTATTALQSGMPIADISKLLGHENVETTIIYTKTSLEEV